MRTLATVLTTTLVFASIAFADPTLAFDDRGFDYRPDVDATTAYVDLERAGEELRFVLAHRPGTHDLPVVMIAEIADLERRHPFGHDVLPTVADLEAISVSGRGADVDLISVDHDGAALAETVGRYLAALQKLGYRVQPAFTTPAVKAFTFGSEAHPYRAVFHAQDGSVQVRIAR